MRDPILQDITSTRDSAVLQCLEIFVAEYPGALTLMPDTAEVGVEKSWWHSSRQST
jgi:hypothetical protein